MARKTFDFNTGTELNRSFLERLIEYLEKRESQVAHDCLRSLEVILKKSGVAHPSLSPPSKLRFSQGVDEFSRKIHDLITKSTTSPSANLWSCIANELNPVLWNHVEFLEGAIEELYFEVKRVDLQSWSPEIMEIVREVKRLLACALDEVEVAVNGLNRSLNDLRSKYDKPLWSIKRIFDGSILDSELITSIRSSRIALLNGYEKFTKMYENYNSIKDQIGTSIIRIGTMPIFCSLEGGIQHHFLELYELLKCYEKNRRRNLLDEKDILMALRKSMSKERAFVLFREYYHALYRELFNQSLEIKKNASSYSTEEARLKATEFLKDVQEEVSLLGSTIDHYREFLLSTDPNPYVRARLGFSEWVLGPEPLESHHLHKFGYSIESLDRLYTQLIESIEKGPVDTSKEEISIQEEIESILHEVGAPLLSEKLLENRLHRFIILLEKFNELGSFNPMAVSQVGIWLSKALRYDWRHHLLYQFPEFHELYGIHMGLAGGIDDKLHAGRLNKFKRVFRELRHWIANRETAQHTHDIDLDINDIKGYLQEFYAHIQRTSGQEGNEKYINHSLELESFAKQLLEYRYVFGNFFYHLNDENTEEYLIHSKCYFVDQYFEAIDNKLNDLSPYLL